MIRIILGIIIGLILGLVNAAAGTVYGMCKSNVIGGDEGKATDFTGDSEGVIFHEKRDEKTIYSLSGARTVDANKPYLRRNHW